MSASGLVDPASAVKLGKALSANYVLVVRQLSFDGKQSVGFGTALTGFGKKKTTYSMDLQAQVLDTETTELVQSQSFSKKIDLSVAVMSNQAMAEDPSVAGAYRGAIDEFAAGFTTNLAAALPLEALVVLARDPRNIALGVGQDVGIRPGTEMEIFEEGAPIKGPGGEVLGYDSRRVGRARVTRVEAKLTWIELVATFGADGNADPAPDFTKVKQYAVAKLAAKP